MLPTHVFSRANFFIFFFAAVVGVVVGTGKLLLETLVVYKKGGALVNFTAGVK